MSAMAFERFENLERFRFLDEELVVRKIGSVAVAEGVVCDRYLFEGDDTRDLGIIAIEAGCKTPRQRVVGGIRTNESYAAGAGHFRFGTGIDGSDELTYGITVATNVNVPFAMDMNPGNVMQWVAAPDQPLVVAEICWPPYADGRFENIQPQR